MEGSLFQVQSVRKFGSDVCSLSKFSSNYFTHKGWTLCVFFTCKKWISCTFYAKNECKLSRFGGFQDYESNIEAKTNSTYPMCLLSVRSPFLVCTEHGKNFLQHLLFNTIFFLPRNFLRPNFLYYFSDLIHFRQQVFYAYFPTLLNFCRYPSFFIFFPIFSAPSFQQVFEETN